MAPGGRLGTVQSNGMHAVTLLCFDRDSLIIALDPSRQWRRTSWHLKPESYILVFFFTHVNMTVLVFLREVMLPSSTE